MLEEFTARELEVLKLLGEGKSNRMIAEELFLALETVRWYNKQIYSKLDVHNRTDAVRKAQELDIGLDSGSEIDVPHNLPEAVTRFRGREQEIRDLKALLRDDSVRLITILGQGGMGKTRLVLALAQEIVKAGNVQGLFFVSLQALSAPEQMVNAIGEAVGYEFQKDKRSPQEQLIDYLANRQMILILDNFEHLLTGAPLVSELLKGASNLRILVTSRERLNLYGEMIFSIEGLQYKSDSESDAERLFIDSVSNLRPQWQIDEDETESIRAICQTLQGMPLAIELAAGWSNVMDVAQIAGELNRSVDILQSSLRDIPERHRSIRLMLDSTWEKLSPEQQTVFMHVSVFRGGFTQDALQALTDVSFLTLQVLLDRALIRREAHRRFAVHELLRQYAEEKAVLQSLYEDIARKHCHYFAYQYLPEKHLDIQGREQFPGLDAMERDFDNIRVAWEYAVQKTDTEALNAMLDCVYLYCTLRGRQQLRGELFQYAFDKMKKFLDEAHPLLARIRIRHTDLIRQESNPLELIQQMIASAESRNDNLELGFCYNTLGRLTFHSDKRQALDYLQSSRKYFEQAEAYHHLIRTLAFIAYVYFLEFDVEQHRVYSEEALRIAELSKDEIGKAIGLYQLSAVMSNNANYFEQSQAFAEESLEIRIRAKNRSGIIFARGLMVRNKFFISDESRETIAQYAEETLALARDSGIYEAIAEGLQSVMHTLIHYGDYDRAIEYGKEVLQISREPIRVEMGIPALLVYAYCGRGEFEEALKWGLKVVQGTYPLLESYLTVVLIAFALILYERGQLVQALETVSHRENLGLAGGFITWKPYLELKENLRQNLSEEDYQKAWERGESMELLPTIKALMDEFGV